jgi:hypothetical protein
MKTSKDPHLLVEELEIIEEECHKEEEDQIITFDGTSKVFFPSTEILIRNREKLVLTKRSPPNSLVIRVSYPTSII